MFTRTEAIDFALERGFKGANFVYCGGDKMQVYYCEDGNCLTCLGRNHIQADLPLEGRLAEALGKRGDGWFVSAKNNGTWYWHFDNAGDSVPHD